MIKLCKWLYINPLSLLLFGICYFTGKLEFLLISYGVMFIHECAHLLAAVCIGLKPAYMVFQPFGLNLRLKNKIVYSLADEIILYLSGPFSNVIMAGIFAVLDYRSGNNTWLHYAYLQNLVLFITNMMPIIPLDGGIVLKKIIMSKTSYKKAERIMMAVSSLFVLGIIAAGFRFFMAEHNFSILFLLLFILGNIFTQKEKYNIDFIKELMFYHEKGKQYQKQNVRLLTAGKNDNLRLLAKNFNIRDFFIVFLLNTNGEIDDILTETQIINDLTK